VHYWVDLQSVHGFCCYNDNIVPNTKCQRVLVLAACLVLSLVMFGWVHKEYHRDFEVGFLLVELNCLDYIYVQMCRSISSQRRLHTIQLPEVEMSASLSSSLISTISGPIADGRVIRFFSS